MRYTLSSLADTRAMGEAFGALLRPGDVVALRGDLGSGKTALTQAIASGMGVLDPVTSPTFTLVHEYRGAIPLFHFDPYRLDRPEEMVDLGFDDYMQRDGVVVVEWADKIEALLPPERFDIEIAIRDTAEDGRNLDAARTLKIVGVGSRPRVVMETLATRPELYGLREQE